MKSRVTVRLLSRIAGAQWRLPLRSLMPMRCRRASAGHRVSVRGRADLRVEQVAMISRDVDGRFHVHASREASRWPAVRSGVGSRFCLLGLLFLLAHYFARTRQLVRQPMTETTATIAGRPCREEGASCCRNERPTAYATCWPGLAAGVPDTPQSRRLTMSVQPGPGPSYAGYDDARGAGWVIFAACSCSRSERSM